MLLTIKPRKFEDFDNSNENMLNKTFENLASRRKFSYSIKVMAWELFCLHKCKSNSKSWEKMNIRNKIFEIGIKEFQNEIDYANIVRSIRELKALMKLILDQDQLSILQFHQTRLINPNDSKIHDLKYTNLPKFNIPNEKWSQKSIAVYENQISEILKRSEDKWPTSNPNVANISDFVLYKEI